MEERAQPRGLGDLPDPDWYLEHVLVDSEPARVSRPAAEPSTRWSEWWAERARETSGCGPARDQGFVLTSAQLRLLGVTRSAARHAVRQGRWTTARHGVIAVVDVRNEDRHLQRRREHAVRAAAAALQRPGHVVSGRSAAILRGLPTIAVPRTPELTEPDPKPFGPQSTTHVYGAGLRRAAIGGWYGVAVTSLARTLVDLGRHDQFDAIAAVDAAMRA